MTAETFFDAARALKRELTGEPAGLVQDEVDALNAVISAWERAGEARAGPGPATPAGPEARADGPQIGLSRADFEQAAAALGCTVAQIRAVDEVESGGGWFTDVRASILDLDGPGGFIDGPNLPKILFEAHHFDRLTGGRFRRSHPNLSSARWNQALYVGGQGEWERLHRAMQLDSAAALKSASWGRYQIMGFNHATAGFSTVHGFVAAMKESERRHLEAFVTFVKNSGLVDELRQVSNFHAACIPFARAYNGPGYAANDYHVKIAKAHKKWSAA